MAYDPTLPSDKDKVRFLVGDTDMANERVSDEEINAMLTQYTYAECAAVRVLESIIARRDGAAASRPVKSKSVDGLSVSYGDIGNAAHITDLLKRLRTECARRSGSGQSIFETLGTYSNDQLVRTNSRGTIVD